MAASMTQVCLLVLTLSSVAFSQPATFPGTGFGSAFNQPGVAGNPLDPNFIPGFGTGIGTGTVPGTGVGTGIGTGTFPTDPTLFPTGINPGFAGPGQPAPLPRPSNPLFPNFIPGVGTGIGTGTVPGTGVGTGIGTGTFPTDPNFFPTGINPGFPGPGQPASLPRPNFFQSMAPFWLLRGGDFGQMMMLSSLLGGGGMANNPLLFWSLLGNM